MREAGLSNRFCPSVCQSSLPGQTLQARLTGDEREREGGSADSEQDSVIQWNVYYIMTTLNLNCACDPCVTSYYRISTESHDCCNLIGSANIPAEPTETCSESADPLSLSLSSPLARPLVFRSSPVKRARRVCPGRLVSVSVSVCHQNFGLITTTKGLNTSKRHSNNDNSEKNSAWCT